MSNQQAIIRFAEAREHYVARRFHEARAAMRRYRKNIQFEQFTHVDQRESHKPAISVVIVSYRTGHGLIECIETVLKQQGPLFEILVVDNGGNESVHEQLGRLPILWISPPLNLLPSEGRNVGAHFAQSDLIVFLDDDALMNAGYLAAANSALENKTLVGLRGRIEPKDTKTQPPPHYDLGYVPVQSEFNLEGNMVIRKSAFDAIGGFDPLMFGHEGKSLTRKVQIRFPNKEIQYRPEISIQHDWAHESRLVEKEQRQILGKAYLEYCRESKLDEGASILIRAQNKLAELSQIIKNLIRHNTYNPIEVWVLTQDTKAALEITRPFLIKMDVRVMPSGVREISDAVDFLKYAHVIVVEPTILITKDVVEEWIENKCKKEKKLLYLNKSKPIQDAVELNNLVAPNKVKIKEEILTIKKEKNAFSPCDHARLQSTSFVNDLIHNRFSTIGKDIEEKIQFMEQRTSFFQQYLNEKDYIIEHLEAIIISTSSDAILRRNKSRQLEVVMSEISKVLIYLWNAKKLLNKWRIQSESARRITSDQALPTAF